MPVLFDLADVRFSGSFRARSSIVNTGGDVGE